MSIKVFKKSQLVSLEFFIDIKSFRSHYGPGVDSVSNRNEYQEHFLGVKGSRCVRLTILAASCAVFTKSGNLNFLEPSGSLQACNGNAFFTCLLTPWSRVLLEKLTSLQLVKIFPSFYGTRRFITALTSASHLSLS